MADSGSTGKRRAPDCYVVNDPLPPGKEDEGFFDRIKKQRSDAGVFDCKKSCWFPAYLRARKEEMGDDAFTEWMGFGVEDPINDVAHFNEWVKLNKEDQRRFTRSESNAVSTDVHVDLASCVVPTEGQEDMHALLSVPGAEKGGAMNLCGDSDVFVLIDQSGSMGEANAMLGDAMVAMADKAKEVYDKAGMPTLSTADRVTVHFAYGCFGCKSHSPGLDDSGQQPPTGYTPWMPLHEMKPCMRNIVSRHIGENMGGTNLMGGLDKALKCLKQRRDDEDLPADYLQWLVIMTDGNPNSEQTEAAITAKIKEMVGDVSIVVSVLCLGDRVNQSLCEKLAGTTRGVFSHAESAAGLTDAFSSILTPINSTSKAFTIELNDKGGRKRVEHFGALTEGNNKALTTFNFGPKSHDGNHIAATVGMVGTKTPTAISPMYVGPVSDLWNSDQAKMPKALKDALETERLVEEHKRKVEEEAARNGLQAAVDLSSQLTAQYSTNGMGPVALARVNAFHQDLDRTVTAQTQASVSLGMHGAPSLPSRAMTVSAVASRSSYSQAY